MNSKFLVVSIFILMPVIRAQDEPSMVCYACNSNTMKSCAYTYNKTSLVECDNPNDTCGIIIKGTDTIRGCSMEIGKGDRAAEPCKTMLCNKKIFPPDRLQCHQCTDCSTLSNDTLFACQHYSAADKCYTDVTDKQSISRGCMSDKPTGLTEFVQQCNTTGCNNQEAIETLTCTQCKSEEDPNCMKIDADPACKVTTKECSLSTLLGRPKNAKCFTYIKDGKVERGCTEKKTNLDPNEKFCTDADYCNNHCLEPIKCLQCDPSDPKCEKPNELTSELCKNDIFCSACASSDGNITRACGIRNLGTCISCQERDACNSQKFCYKCSTDMNPNCATWKDLSEIKVEICKDPKDACAVTLINGRTVERACKSPNQCKPPNCKICSEKDKCNEAAFPDDIQRCIQCSSKNCVKEQQKEDSKLCDLFDPNDSCYAYADKSGVAHRGCTSNAEEYLKCNQTGNCWTCHGNSCNTPKLLKCYSCLTGIKENCGKWTNPDSIDTITCQNPRQVCATVVSGNQVKRGCEFPEAFTCEDGDSSCQKCSNADNCNKGQVNKMPIRCLRCSGEAGCDKEQNKTKATVCGDNDAQCYAYTNRNGQVFRGCTNEADYKNCPKDIDGKCWTCNKDSCNYMKMPSCYTCASGLNENCATAKDISSIQSQLCQNPSDHCVSRRFNETVVHRGCQSLKEIDPDCGFNLENCKTCDENDNCNVDPIPRKEFTCLECSGTDDCRTGQIPSPKLCSTYESCYMYRNASGKVFRGCIAATDDLDKCEKESNSHCWTCKGDQCNTEKLRRCYTCESDTSGACGTFKNANQINSETCYNPEEVCAAIRIGDKVQRGCRLPKSLNCKTDDPMCRSCTKDNCNDGSLAEYPAKCITCSGTDDCINQTDPSKARYCKKNVDGEPCFAYADKDGKVFRGCVADADEYGKCQNSTNVLCWKCSGDGCNKITFSHCLSCKSAPGENCATLNDLNSIPSKVCPNPSQHCISRIVGNTVQRDCYSDSGLPAGCAFNTQNCKTCDKDNCNTEFMPRKQIKCIHCMGSEDCRNEQDPEKAATCTTYESCVVSKNAIGKIDRGCVSKPEDFANCIKAGDGFCWTCTGNTCNTPKVRSCYTCESDINGYCGTWANPTLIRSQTCQNPDEICATITIGKRVQRKCAKPENVTCLPGDASCQKCDTDDCNKGLVHENPKRCHKCSGTADCRNKQIEGKEQDCPVYGQPDACYAYANENGQVFRGCKSSQKEYDNCKKAGNGECWTCATDGCNKDQILECFTCTTANNTNCGVWNDGNGIATQLCKNPGEVCASYKQDGQTVRGCSKPDKTCTPLTATCQNCKEDKCNAGSIPKVQLKCHECSNTDACQEEQNSTSLSFCSTTETNPSCWAYADPKGKMIRGCSGDAAGLQKCKDSRICRTCNSDGCNNFPYLSTQSMQCHKCNDSGACGWGQPNSTLAPCTNKIAYHLPEGCVWRRTDNNFERGCLFDLGICRESKEFCAMCSSKAACNNENIITQSCIQCKSATSDPKCGKAEGIGGMECPALFTTFEDRGCYTRITDMQGIVERGCSQELSAADLSACKADKDHKYCEYCDSQDCNNKKAPNSAPVAAGLTLGFVLLSSLVQIIF